MFMAAMAVFAHSNINENNRFLMIGGRCLNICVFVSYLAISLQPIVDHKQTIKKKQFYAYYRIYLVKLGVEECFIDRTPNC